MSKHTTIKGNCVVKQRESLFCAGFLWECSCSSSSLQHGSTALFSSFIFQFGRPQSVTCQQHLYYIGEARRKKTCLEVFPYQQCGLCSQKYVEISQVFLSAAFPVPAPAICLQMGAGVISQCLRSQLGSQLRAGLVTESPSLAVLTNPVMWPLRIRLSGKEDIGQKFHDLGGLFQP